LIYIEVLKLYIEDNTVIYNLLRLIENKGGILFFDAVWIELVIVKPKS